MCIRDSPRTRWLFTIYKKIPEILVGNFRSVRTVRVVYHLPKISGLSHRTRLDSELQHETSTKHKKLVNGKRISIRNVPIGKTGLPFQNFRLSPRILQWKERNKISTFAPKIWWSASKLQRLVPKQVIFRITFRLNSVIVLLPCPNVGFAVASVADLFTRKTYKTLHRARTGGL